ncbi:glycosyl hydrolase family 43 [Bifidobacterium callitrichos]|uniref:Glycosyl hydrolase family 43 n=1 Tax=Bifidobacterium callitrichos TaxID=762209 RepID=A0A5M9ZBM5_9BIFI|nr:family 43 glycosylhydrolase [Bifidobacterium callitrichos]KAA8815963.1 glycosyl hydrolase family 43 [Bifidobacterium callitrichos]
MGVIFNGVPWFDDRGEIVNAHGACVVREEDTFYLFGEYKTDDRNMFNGFSCYSSRDLSRWHFEGLALPRQQSGRLGPDRVGERVKVMRCPATGSYVMFMHSDDLHYRDPMTLVAVSDSIKGEYQIVGPLLCGGEPIRMWDMGTFQDSDGTGYLLTHGGHVYRLSDDYLTAELIQPDNLEPYGESPAMAHVGDTYYLIMSHLTGWDRNDNFYLTAPDPAGPWTYRGNIAPKGSDTWDSQSSFVFPLHTGHGDELIYMGDRWSFPHQASCASQVWLPLRFESSHESVEIMDAGPSASIETADSSGSVAVDADPRNRPLLPQYAEAWDSTTGEPVPLAGDPLDLRLCSNRRGDTVTVRFAAADGVRFALFGHRGPDCGVGRIELRDDNGETWHAQLLDTYAQHSYDGPLFISEPLSDGNYTVTVTALGETGLWIEKSGRRLGGTDAFFNISQVRMVRV